MTRRSMTKVFPNRSSSEARPELTKESRWTFAQRPFAGLKCVGLKSDKSSPVPQPSSRSTWDSRRVIRLPRNALTWPNRLTERAALLHTGPCTKSDMGPQRLAVLGPSYFSCTTCVTDQRGTLHGTNIILVSKVTLYRSYQQTLRRG